MYTRADRVCGLEVSRDFVIACARLADKSTERREVMKIYSTMRKDLLSLRDWLTDLRITHTALVRTGVFWKPVHRILEGHFHIVLVDSSSLLLDREDRSPGGVAAELAHGLENQQLIGKPVPPRRIREIEDLTRFRRALTLERGRCVHRLHTVLQDAGIKLSSVVKKIAGRSGIRILEAMIDGVHDTEALADLAKGRLRSKLPELRLAVQGGLRDSQAFLAREMLDHLKYLDQKRDRIQVRLNELSASDEPPTKSDHPAPKEALTIN